MSDSNTRRKDPTWKYTKLKSESNTLCHICIYCGKETNGGISRAKEHLIGPTTISRRSNVVKCRKVPAEVKDELLAYQNGAKKMKQNLYMDDQNEMMIDATEKRIGNSNSGSINLSKMKNTMTNFLMKEPKKEVSKRKQMRQIGIKENMDKDIRAKTIQYIARWFYQAGIPFNALKLESFDHMVEAIGQYGPGLRPPSYHEIRVPLLERELESTKKYVEEHKQVWQEKGCTIMSDGWTDRRQRSIINFLINSSAGTVFLESVDASHYSKTAVKLFELLDSQIEAVGENLVIQVITDNHSSYVLAGQMLMEKRPHIYWTPYTAHCLDLMLEDIGKLPEVKPIIKKGLELTSYIYNHGIVLSMMRKFTNGAELVRSGITRFATSFLTLASIYKQKENLRRMFVSEDWNKSKHSIDHKGKKAKEIILKTTFWNDISFTLKVTSPIMKMLRLVDGDKRPAMGYIYEAMDRVKDVISSCFREAKKYEKVFDIIDNRWRCQIRQPLHQAGYYLNPEFFYKNKSKIQADGVLMERVYSVISRLMPDPNERMIIDQELSIYNHVSGLFGTEYAIRNRDKRAPAEWWEMYGASAPTLQRLTIKILGLTCSATGCERNWSVFEQIHTKKRNRLDQKRLNDLVFIKYNQALQRRFNMRDIIDPISLDSIDESCEWLTREMEDAGEQQFGDEDLTWRQIEEASGEVDRRWSLTFSRSKEKRPTSTTRPTSISTPAMEEREELDSEEEEEEEGEEEEFNDEEILVEEENDFVNEREDDD